VLIEGDDIVGDGVNVAARLEGICAFLLVDPTN
jgi:class 3 adenylate cyclase